MKTRFFLPFVLNMLFITLAIAQSYKVARIDSVGSVTDASGKWVGSLTVEGTIRNARGVKMAFIDKRLELVDTKSGKKMGLTQLNGDFTPYYLGSPVKPWSMSSPSNGICYLKNANRNVIAEVNEKYKRFGACAIHFFDDESKEEEAKGEKKE